MNGLSGFEHCHAHPQHLLSYAGAYKVLKDSYQLSHRDFLLPKRQKKISGIPYT